MTGLAHAFTTQTLAIMYMPLPKLLMKIKKLQEVVKLNGNNLPVWINLIKKEGEDIWGPDDRLDAFLPPL